MQLGIYLKFTYIDTTEHDIQNYIKQKTEDIVTLEKVQMKTDKGHNAFKVLVSKQKLDMFLNNAHGQRAFRSQNSLTFRHKAGTHGEVAQLSFIMDVYYVSKCVS